MDLQLIEQSRQLAHSQRPSIVIELVRHELESGADDDEHGHDERSEAGRH